MIYVILGILVLLVIWFIKMYNGLVKLRNRVKDQWAQIEVHLKKRFDLIPNLVETVKGYAKHESVTLEQVIAARNKFTTATTPEAEMEASGELSRVLSKIMMLTENYPELKADRNFLQLQSELKDIEEKIAYARQFYNDSVLSYKNKLEMFPSNIIANMFNFLPEKFFEAEKEAKEVPKVSFE